MPASSSFKRRYRATPYQVRLLDQFFAENETPDTLKREHIAQYVDMPAKSVHIWFQNRRAKKNLELRKAGKPVPPRYPSLHNFKRFLSLPNTHIFYMGPNSTSTSATSAQSPNPAGPATTFETVSSPTATPCQCNHNPSRLPPSPPTTAFPSPLTTEQPCKGYGFPHYFTALPSPQSDYTTGPSCEPSPLLSPLPSPHLIPHKGTSPPANSYDLSCEESATPTTPTSSYKMNLSFLLA